MRNSLGWSENPEDRYVANQLGTRRVWKNRHGGVFLPALKGEGRSSFALSYLKEGRRRPTISANPRRGKALVEGSQEWKKKNERPFQ